MVRDADRDDQIAAARSIPRDSVVQLPDAPVEVIAPKTNATVAQATTTTKSNSSAPAANTTVPVSNQLAATQPASKAPEAVEDLPAYVPAPKSLVSDRAASEVATVNASTAGTQNAVLSSLPRAEETSLNTKSGTRIAQLRFLPTDDVLKVGEKRRYAVQLNSEVSLSLALLALRFDPKVVKINAVSAGSLLGSQADGLGANFSHSVSPEGVCLVSISALNGKTQIKGSGELLFIEIEAIGAGDAALVFDKGTLHLVATDAKDVTTDVKQGTATVRE